MIRVDDNQMRHLQDPCKYLQVLSRSLGMTGLHFLASGNQHICGPVEHSRSL